MTNLITIDDDMRVWKRNILSKKNTWKKWKLWNECSEAEKNEANLREIRKDEVILDDDKQQNNILLNNLTKDKYDKRVVIKSNHGNHIHLFFDNLAQQEPEVRKKIRLYIIEKYNCDKTKANENTLISIENRPHHKNPKLICNIIENNIFYYHINEKIIEKIIENIKKTLQTIKYNNTTSDINFKDYFINDPFFNFISVINWDELYSKCNFNDVISKNLAIASVKSGKTKEEIDDIIKPIIFKIKGYSYNSFEGWYYKALNKELTNYNIKEINNWGQTYIARNFYDKLQTNLKKQEKEAIGIKNIDLADTNLNKTEYLSSFIFDKNQVVKNKVFSSGILENLDIFYFGLLLPREEDFKDKNGNIIGKQQIWRPVLITSDKKGLVISKWLQQEYKIQFEETPYSMNLRWELEDIDYYLHKNPPIIKNIDLFNIIKKQYKHYLYFREENWYDCRALWDMGTYLHRLFSAYPIWENRGLKNSAKTQSEIISSYITLNATEVMINPSESTLFRETELIRPTKYIDEAEKLFKWNKGEIEFDNRVELINASYTRNGVVPRQEKLGNKYITKWYHVYSPTMISSIGGLYGATESRAITQIHIRAPDTDKRGELDPEDDVNDSKWEKIRNMCYLWTLQNWKKILEEYRNFNINNIDNIKNMVVINKRDLQLWKPLLVIAKIIDENELLPKIAKFAEKISKIRKYDSLSEGTIDYKILVSVENIFNNRKRNIDTFTSGKNRIYVEEIRNTLNNLFFEEDKRTSGYNKTISSHLDKLGFLDYRDFDTNKGSFFEITEEIFESIVNTIAPQIIKTNININI